MADASRDVLIRVKLETQKGDDLRKSVEASVVAPIKKAQAELDQAQRQAQQLRQSVEQYAQTLEGRRASARMDEKLRNDRIKQLARKKKSDEEEVELTRLMAEKEAKIEDGRRTLKEIRMKERLAIHRREKAEEAAISQAAAAKEEAAEKARVNLRRIRASELLAIHRRQKAEETRISQEATAAQERAEAAHEKFKKIRLSERLAAFKRQKAEELKATQEAEARKAQAEAGKGGFFSEQKGRLARVGSAVVAAPAAFGAGVNFVNQLGDTLKAFGDRQALLNSQAYQAGKNFWEGVAQFGKFVFRLPQGRDANKPGGISIDGVPIAEVMQADEAKGLELTRQLNEIILQRTKAERDLLAAEKERIERRAKGEVS